MFQVTKHFVCVSPNCNVVHLAEPDTTHGHSFLTFSWISLPSFWTTLPRSTATAARRTLKLRYVLTMSWHGRTLLVYWLSFLLFSALCIGLLRRKILGLGGTITVPADSCASWRRYSEVVQVPGLYPARFEGFALRYSQAFALRCCR